MKKFFLCIFIMVMLCASSAFGEKSCVSSGLLTADALILTGSGQLCGVIVVTDDANDSTISIHDSLDNSGTQLLKLIVPLESGHGGALYPVTIAAITGIFADITTSGAMGYIVYYRP